MSLKRVRLANFRVQSSKFVRSLGQIRLRSAWGQAQPYSGARDSNRFMLYFCFFFVVLNIEKHAILHVLDARASTPIHYYTYTTLDIAYLLFSSVVSPRAKDPVIPGELFLDQDGLLLCTLNASTWDVCLSVPKYGYRTRDFAEKGCTNDARDVFYRNRRAGRDTEYAMHLYKKHFSED